jgi:DNA replication protein DnaC
MEQHIGEELKKILPLSSLKSAFYEYILTPDEEKAVISHALTTEMKGAALKMSGLGYLPQSIEQKLKEIDFRGQIDEFELLNKANVRKHWQLQEIKDRQQERENENRKRNELIERCNAKYFFSLMVNHFRNENMCFVQDASSIPYIKVLCFFMGRDERFETELNLNPQKGLWVIGSPGIGKTKLIEAIAENEITPIKIVSMLTVADTVKTNGEFELGEFNKILLDDVGSEEATVNHYGTKINWLKDFLELFYAKRQGFSRVLVTSNDSFDQIEEKYGYRVRSRIREMFNVVKLEGKDRRK